MSSFYNPILHTPQYKRAFEAYFRYGTPVWFSLKMEAEAAEARTTTHYIWRTVGDGRVRASHAANEGKIFSWDEPPETGHPGEDFNCRCWAEPIEDDYYTRQKLITDIKDSRGKWSDIKLTQHYLHGNGTGVTLSEIGYLKDVIDYYANHAIASDGKPGVYRAVGEQIIKRATEEGKNFKSYPFENTYDFTKGVLFTLGHSTVSGQFLGETRKEGKFLVISGIINYEFKDKYKDPASFVERAMSRFKISREDAERLVGDKGDFAGVVYPITDKWQTKFNATVRIEK